MAVATVSKSTVQLPAALAILLTTAAAVLLPAAVVADATGSQFWTTAGQVAVVGAIMGVVLRIVVWLAR